MAHSCVVQLLGCQKQLQEPEMCCAPPLEAVRTTILPKTLCELAQTPPLPPQHLKINSSSSLAFSASLAGEA